MLGRRWVNSRHCLVPRYVILYRSMRMWDVAIVAEQAVMYSVSEVDIAIGVVIVELALASWHHRKWLGQSMGCNADCGYYRQGLKCHQGRTLQHNLVVIWGNHRARWGCGSQAHQGKCRLLQVCRLQKGYWHGCCMQGREVCILQSGKKVESIICQWMTCRDQWLGGCLCWRCSQAEKEFCAQGVWNLGHNVAGSWGHNGVDQVCKWNLCVGGCAFAGTIVQGQGISCQSGCGQNLQKFSWWNCCFQHKACHWQRKGGVAIDCVCHKGQNRIVLLEIAWILENTAIQRIQYSIIFQSRLGHRYLCQAQGGEVLQNIWHTIPVRVSPSDGQWLWLEGRLQ